jgi:probable DNA metabolism protein
MKVITLKPGPDFETWRNHARQCFQQNMPPDQILWQNNTQKEQDLFSHDEAPNAPMPSVNIFVSKSFIELAKQAICHSSVDRYALLYRIFWRLNHENKNLLSLKTDNDILKLKAFVKAVRRDAYKIKAFLRFREADTNHFIAWYEPEHYTLELSLPFFQTRFKNMRWTIMTPYCVADWNLEKLGVSDNTNATYPENDQIEKYWLAYYANIFNPARPKKSAMLNQMPKKYWKNMPETVLIKDMLQNSESRARNMINKGNE